MAVVIAVVIIDIISNLKSFYSFLRCQVCCLTRSVLKAHIQLLYGYSRIIHKAGKMAEPTLNSGFHLNLMLLLFHLYFVAPFVAPMQHHHGNWILNLKHWKCEALRYILAPILFFLWVKYLSQGCAEFFKVGYLLHFWRIYCGNVRRNSCVKHLQIIEFFSIFENVIW